MKNHPFRSSLALLALCSALSLQAKNQPAGEIPVAQVAAAVKVNGDTVAPGTSRILVSMRLGNPSAVLADGTWLYYGYDLRMSADDAGRPATLVVRFTNNRVSGLTLADQATVVALRRAPRHPANDQILTAANDRR